MEYKGYTYHPEEEVEYGMEGAENIKMWHYAIALDGRMISFDWSPYQTPSYEDFVLWIELGMPDRFDLRKTGGPLDSKDLVELTTRMQGDRE